METRVLLFTMAFLAVFAFDVSYAQSLFPEQLVPCNGPDCDFGAFVKLVGNILKFIIAITVTGSVLVIAWAGFKYITAQGSSGEISKAHELFKQVAIGLVIVLAAWLIVSTILKVLTDKPLEEYQDLLIEN